MVRKHQGPSVTTQTSTFLCTRLRELASKHNCRFEEAARKELLQILFRSLSFNKEEYFRLLFHGGEAEAEAHDWNLSQAQGAEDGAEYTEAARGKRCGHIFRNGEATYYCKTCASDDTCVLCARCFEASDHDGHQFSVSVSGGSFGCCDCGDDEAWNHPVKCSIHSALADAGLKGKGKADALSALPETLQDSIQATIARSFDFLCDVFSAAAPEHMRAPKDEGRIRSNEQLSRLKGKYYQGTDINEEDHEYALLLWNDEKHTLNEVEEHVAKACRSPKSYGTKKAMEVDTIGRSIVDYSTDVAKLIARAKILEQIKVTVTIRSARDTFREQMCGVLVDWLCDISGCSVGNDHFIFMNAVCNEMLKPWKIGSGAPNLQVAPHGIRDELKSEDRLQRMQEARINRRLRAEVERARTNLAVGQTGGRVTIAVGAGGRFATVDAAGVDADPSSDDDENDADDDEDEDMPDVGANTDPDNEDNDEDEQSRRVLQEILAEGEDMELDEDDDGDDDGILDGDEDDEDDNTAWVITNADLMGVEGDTHLPLSPDPLSQEDGSDQSESDAPAASVQNDAAMLITKIPRTPRVDTRQGTAAPAYWADSGSKWQTKQVPKDDTPIFEDLNKRVRIDFLILYDLRMWKTLRDRLRHLYISTVITVPYFKRVLGLRFASVYTYLAQLYLIGDREPDHSIINISLQMLTTPSITAEIVERGSFFTKLLAILYTFLTKRQVGHPEDVDLTATMSLDPNVMQNRRNYHFFHDLKYLLDSKHVQQQIREREEYLQQCLDFIKLYQGICPNLRAVNEHVEYESDIWISASIIGRDITRMTRHFCEAFAWTRMQDPLSITRAIRQAAKACIINSMGAEIDRFSLSALRHPTRFHIAGPFALDTKTHTIVKFEVENEPMSFHYTLHYMLSWLIDCGKSMSKSQLRGLLEFTQDQLQKPDLRSHITYSVEPAGPGEYLLSLFDVPLRVCAWLAQMRAGMWVRNGLTLRHQMQTFRSIGSREISHQRDIFMLQVGFIVCPPDTFLLSIIDRYGLLKFMNGDYTPNTGWEDHHTVDMAEDFIQLLTVLLCDRSLLLPPEEEHDSIRLAVKKDIAQALCFKPLSHSDLVARLSDRGQEHEDFPAIIRELTTFRAPEGMNDSGLFELKPEYYEEVDPYNAWYSKNQREEAESVWRKKKSELTGQPVEEVVYEPKLRKIRGGVFADLQAFTQTPLFAQVIFQTLRLALQGSLGQIPPSRFETFLPGILHLILLSIQEDRNPGMGLQPHTHNSFIDAAIFSRVGLNDGSDRSASILQTLFDILNSNKYEGLSSKIRLVLRRMAEKRQTFFNGACEELGVGTEWMQTKTDSSSVDNAAEKKRKALERNARVMANMKQQQKAFEQNQTAIDWGVDEDDSMDEDDMSVTLPSKKVWNFPEGTCIFCQEATNDHRLYGSLSFICESSIFRETNLNDRDYVGEVSSTPQNLDHSAEAIRPFGVAGQNVKRVSKVKADGTVSEFERRGLGKGWPKGYHTKGPVATGCGHLMHYTCFETYCNATARRHSMQVARNHPERKDLLEFVCPLCKALGNSFLPIVFKPKELTPPANLSNESFDDFLNNKAPLIRSKGFSSPQYTKIFQNIAKEALVPGLANKVPEPGKSSGALNEQVAKSEAKRNILPAFLGYDSRPDSSRSHSRASSSNEVMQTAAMSDLIKAYGRLQDTLTTNKISRHIQVDSSPTPFGPDQHVSKNGILASALGFSISSIEISQRGVGASETNWISSISELNLTQLRIFSATVSTYLALAGLDPSVSSGPMRTAAAAVYDVQETVRQQIQQLLGHNSHDDYDVPNSPSALFDRDTFVFLAECSLYFQPHLHLNIQHLLRLCYLAEIVKVVVTFLQNPTAAMEYNVQDLSDRTTQAGALEEIAKSECTPAQSQVWSSFVQHIYSHCQTHLHLDNEKLNNPNERVSFDQFLRVAVQSYLLPFLRKTLLLMHIRYGYDYSASEGPWLDREDSELHRLTKLLDLPSLDDLVASLMSPTSSAKATDGIIQHWMQHYKWALTERLRNNGLPPEPRMLEIHLPHPAIYELVALPYALDLLNTESMSRRCPTTGKDINDGCLCLFCGDIFCGQAQCCSKQPRFNPLERHGGCSQHLETCGGKIGMFLNIRKSHALFLNERQGSMFAAPYMDEHGEADTGLRRRNQLFLNRKRYDKLFRDVWLSHGIPSKIARKLEGDVNNGGWETM